MNRLYVCCCPAPFGIWDDLAGLLDFVDAWQEDINNLVRKKKLMSLFDISENELTAAGPGRLEDLVLERVALLSVNR